MVKVSNRLECVIRMVTKGHAAVDVGCDHGYVPIALVERDISPCAVASDIRKGPLESASEHIRQAGLTEQITTACTDGVPADFPAFTGDVPVTVIIAGMGGLMMTGILDAAAERKLPISEIVASPQRDADAFRMCLARHGYRIQDEAFLTEDGKFYTVIRANRTEDVIPDMTEEELLYGPILLQRGDALLNSWLVRRLKQTEDIREKIDPSQERGRTRRTELDREIRTMKSAIERIAGGAYETDSERNPISDK